MFKNHGISVFVLACLVGLVQCNTVFSAPQKTMASYDAIDTVPFLNQREESYFIGNGILGGGGDSKGNWNFLIGPDYTSPNFLKSEIITITVNGVKKILVLEMHRIRSSGIFYDMIEAGDARIHVFEYATPGMPLITRHFIVENTSGNHALTFQIHAEIQKGNGISDGVYRQGPVIEGR